LERGDRKDGIWRAEVSVSGSGAKGIDTAVAHLRCYQLAVQEGARLERELAGKAAATPFYVERDYDADENDCYTHYVVETATGERVAIHKVPKGDAHAETYVAY